MYRNFKIIAIFCLISLTNCHPLREGKDNNCAKLLLTKKQLSFQYCDTCYTTTQARAYEASLGSMPLPIKEYDFTVLFELRPTIAMLRPNKKDTVRWIKENPPLHSYLFFIRKKVEGAYWYEVVGYEGGPYDNTKRDSVISIIWHKYFIKDRYFSMRFPAFIDGRDSSFNYQDWKKQFDFLECYGRAQYPDGKEGYTNKPYEYGENSIPGHIYSDTKEILWDNNKHLFTISTPIGYFLEDFGGQLKFPITEKDMAIYSRKIQWHDTSYLKLFPDWKNVEPIIIKSVRKKK